jgi:pimeloyl-ACP methyl ester carboxylesterase
MTVVLVHGNPETDAIWDPLVDALERKDVVRLSPPGFGAPLNDGFPATYLAYRDWLETQLEGVDEPIDLVGHDWGGGHVVNAMMHRPELVRSWASDAVGLFDPEYVWHDLAQVWQTPGEGEQLVNTMLGGTVEDRAGQMAALGIPIDIATSIATAQGPEMGRAILSLYRSARQPAMGAHWRMLQRGRGFPYLPPRTPTSAPTNCAAGPRTGPAHTQRCSKTSDIGGWCRTRRAARRLSAASGTR